MKDLNNYISETERVSSIDDYINEGLGDAFKSFVKVFQNLINHGEVSNKDLVTIELDAKTFGKLKRELDSQTKKDWPSLAVCITISDDLWEVYYVEEGENKYGDSTTIFTYIGHYDCRKTDIGKLEIDKKYQEFVEKYIEQFK